MSRSSQTIAVYAVIALLVGAVIGYLAAGPLNYDSQIASLNSIIDDYEAKGFTEKLSGELSIAGSTTVLPIATECANLFMESYPGVTISVAGGGSGHGVRAAAAGEVDIGEASRNVKDSEWLAYPDLNVFAVGKDSVAVVVNPSNPLAGTLDLTLEQVAQVFAGEMSNWNQLGGPSQAINVYTREAGSGTRETFETYVMGDREFAAGASVKPSNGEMRAATAGDQYGIAYISLGYVDETVSSAKINGVEATIANVKAGNYPITRILWMMTKSFPSVLERAFISFVLSEVGQGIIEDLGFISISA